MSTKNEYQSDELALKLLHSIGNSNPAAHQLELMGRLISQISVSQQLLFDNRLTLQERLCLLYAAHGYSVKQTAKLLNCDLRKARYHREEILKKLQCINIAHAVFVGLKYGHILPYEEMHSN